MSEQEDAAFDIPAQLAAENKALAIDMSQTNMPLDMTVRSMALTLATRHCGDRVVKEGNLYQQLKMDNKLGGVLTEEHVIRCALIFERFLWGEFSQGLVKDAMTNALGEAEKALKDGLGMDEASPINPHTGTDGAA